MQGLAQAGQRCLRGGISGAARQSPESRAGGDGADISAFILDHDRQNRFNDPDHPAEVDLHDFIKGFHGHFIQGHFRVFRRNSLKYPLCRISALQYLPYPLPSLPPLKPPRHRLHLGSKRLYLSLGFLQFLFQNIQHYDMSALPGEFQCHCLSDAPGRSRHDSGLSPAFPLFLNPLDDKNFAAPKAAVTLYVDSGFRYF